MKHLVDTYVVSRDRRCAAPVRIPDQASRARHRYAAVLLGLAVACAALPTNDAHAQAVEQDFQIWNALFATADLTSGSSGSALWLDVHARRGDAGTVHIMRPGVGYRITPWLSVWAGYGWIPTFRDGPEPRHDEHRIWEQAILAHSPHPEVALQSRTRLEQRFGGDELGHRVREFVRVNWMPESSPVGLAVWDELFVGFNDTDWAASAGYDQNRLFIGTAFPVRPWARFETGYLLVHLNRVPNQIAHVAAINLFLSLAPQP